MTGLPITSGSQCIAALQGLGYQVVRTRGSHVRLVCPGRKPVTVPKHNELDRGTLRTILRSAEISVGKFNKLLKG